MEPAAAPTPEDRYPDSAVIGAALAVFFFPLISLIVALLLIGLVGGGIVVFRDELFGPTSKTAPAPRE